MMSISGRMAVAVENGQRVAEVRLKGGWGAVFRTWDQEDLPVGGVRVTLDGREVGRTDEMGSLVVQLDHRPQTFAIEHATHTWVGGDVGPGAEGLPERSGQIELIFAPKP